MDKISVQHTTPTPEQVITAFKQTITQLLDLQHVVSLKVPGATTGTRSALVDAAFALEEEVHEVLRELHWKPWKKPGPVNVERVIEETADVTAFFALLLIELAAALNMPHNELVDAIADAYGKVYMRNLQRFANGAE